MSKKKQLKSRITIKRIRPKIQNGKYLAKATVNENVKISACVFFENVKDILSVWAVVQGKKYEMKLTVPGRDIYKVNIPIKKVGVVSYHIEAAVTHYKETVNDKVVVRKYEKPLFLEKSDTYKIKVERKEAVFGSWYEIFVRNYGAKLVNGKYISGTLKNAQNDIKRIADMGFSVIYMTPISPIGITNRKGKKNSLNAKKNDPGSPYAVGNSLGGHDVIDPQIGTVSDFKDFVKCAKKHGIEIAYDIALQCSPDHPWVKKHPNWFRKDKNGNIAFAENPPKKYQDIYPLNFDNDYDGLYNAIFNVFDTWAKRGVRIFRVDNPHTKPLCFWQQLISDLQKKYPYLVFLSESKTHPPIMDEISSAGFSQTYTYFPWRENGKEIKKYFKQVFEKEYYIQRPSFWQNTPDELLPYMVKGGVNAFVIRAVLAGFSSPAYGVLSGYELVENKMRLDGTHETEKNDKYEYIVRNFKSEKAKKITNLLTFINKIRNENSEFSELNNMLFHKTTLKSVVCFSKAKGGHNIPDKRLGNYMSTKHKEEQKLLKKHIKIIFVNTNYKKSAYVDFKIKGLPKKFLVKDLETGKKYNFPKTIKVNQFRIFETV